MAISLLALIASRSTAKRVLSFVYLLFLNDPDEPLSLPLHLHKVSGYSISTLAHAAYALKETHQTLYGEKQSITITGVF